MILTMNNQNAQINPSFSRLQNIPLPFRDRDSFFGKVPPFMIGGMLTFQVVLCAVFSVGIISPLYFAGSQAVLLFGMFFLRKPKITLMAFLFARPLLDYFRFYSNIAFQMENSINLAAVVTLVMVFCGIFYILIHKVRFLSFPLVVPFSVFLLICLFSIAISPFKIVDILIFDLFKTEKDLRRLITVILISAIIPILVGFYQTFMHSGLVMYGGYNERVVFNRIFSTFSHPNMYAFYLIMILPFSVALCLESASKSRKFALFIFNLALGISLILTFARGAWIGVMAVFFVLGLFKYRKTFILFLVAVVILTLLVPALSERFSELSDPHLEGGSSIIWRIQLWEQSLGHSFKKPILGHGLGGFYSIAYSNQGYYIAAHNDYLRVILETGVFGLGAYLFLLFSLIKGTLRIYKRLVSPYFKLIALSFLSACAAYLLISIGDNLIRSTTVQIFFWALAAVVFNLISIEQKTIGQR